MLSPSCRVRRRCALLAAAILTCGLLSLPSSPAATAATPPPNPSNQQLTAGQAKRQASAAELGALAGKIASLDGQLAAAAAEVDAKIAKYDATNRALQSAVTQLTAANTALRHAVVTTREARTILRQYVGDQYRSGPDATMAALLTSPDVTGLLETMQLQRFVGAGQQRQLNQRIIDTVASANAEAAQRGAVQTADGLQKKADTEKASALALMAAFWTKKAELATQRITLTKQAAAASSRLQGLLNQRAAYNNWVTGEQRRQAAADRVTQDRLKQKQERDRPATRPQPQSQQAPEQAPQQALAPNPGTPAVSVPPAGQSSSDGIWVSPLRGGNFYVSTCFCLRAGVFHAGDDLAAAMGTPISAVGAGIVAAAGPARGFGNWVVIDHGNGAFSVYGHMRVLAVSAGQSVTAGQTIAYVGSEGVSTGPHLHLEIRIGGVSGSPVDPQVWLARRGVNL